MSNEAGRTRLTSLAGLTVLAAALAWSYWYHQSDVFTSIDSTKWYANGSISGSSIGLVSSGSGGGAVISKISVPYSPADYEVRATIQLAGSGGGDYALYARASNDAAWVAGSYYSAEWYSPACDAAGNCGGWWVFFKKVSNQAPELIGWTYGATSNYTADMRLVVRGTQLYLWMNGAIILTASDSALTSGQPGAGARATPANCAVKQVDIGHLDDQAPLPVAFLTASRFPSSIRLRWLAGADPSTIQQDAGAGTGPAEYHIYRNGAWVTSFFNGSLPGNLVDWVDFNVAPQATYTYQIKAIDYHRNESTLATVTVQPNAVITGYDARQTGVKTNGTYWGGGGENIDMRSGNLNFSIPLVQAQMRGGRGVTAALSYNSQIWQMVGQTEWRTGKDTGYGLGWRLLIGSVSPIYENGSILWYVFSDSTGAEYKLDQQASGVWTSLEGIHATYDTNVSPPRLKFNDGTFWEMGSQAGGIEEDIGTVYPTRIQDSNGNFVAIRYRTGASGPGPDSSSRIDYIEDVRAAPVSGAYRTYTFTYGNYGGSDPFERLTGITNHIQSGETYAFYYWPTVNNAGFPSQSPFSGAIDPRPSRLLNYVYLTDRDNSSYTISYEPSGEITSVFHPRGGRMQWTYQNAFYANNYVLREVTGRTITPVAGEAGWTYGLSGDQSTNKTVRSWAHVIDASTQTTTTQTKTYWEFHTSGVLTGLLAKKEVIDNGTGTVKSRDVPSWANSPSNNPYISSIVSTTEPSNSAAAQTAKSEQVVDGYGNVTFKAEYNLGTTSAGSILRQTWLYYLGSDSELPGGQTAYPTQYFIRNRLTRAVVRTYAPNGTYSEETPIRNRYDQYDNSAGCDLWPSTCGYTSGLGALTDRYNSSPTPRQHDSAAGTSAKYRGNVTTVNAGTFSMAKYDVLGSPTAVSDANGYTYATTLPDTGKNFAVPTSITPSSNSSWTHTLSWNSHLGLASDSGPNGAFSSISYDGKGRPTETAEPSGIVKFTYSLSYPQKVAKNTTTGQWVKEGYDGFGRTIVAETGYGGDNAGASGTTLSYMETKYQPCACSPMGRVKTVSRPYAPGATKYWTETNYDWLGRTVSVVQPAFAAGGAPAGTTTYEYVSNTVKVTKPGGRWKKYSMNGIGQLVQVNEPHPVSGADYVTTYEYTVKGQLAKVNMTRPEGSQTRTFEYHADGQLWKSTIPESGLTTYNQDPATKLITDKIDAKGQKTKYIRDTYRRVSAVERYKNQSDAQPDACQGTVTYHDTNPFAAGFTNLNGRAAVLEYHICTTESNGAVKDRLVREMYGYSTAGSVLSKRLQVTRTDLNPQGQPVTGSANLDATYTWWFPGRLKSMRYPDLRQGHPQRHAGENGDFFEYQVDGGGRYTGMTVTPLSSGAAISQVSGIQYDASGAMKEMVYLFTAADLRKSACFEGSDESASGNLALGWVSQGWNRPFFARRGGKQVRNGLLAAGAFRERNPDVQPAGPDDANDRGRSERWQRAGVRPGVCVSGGRRQQRTYRQYEGLGDGRERDLRLRPVEPAGRRQWDGRAGGDRVVGSGLSI